MERVAKSPAKYRFIDRFLFIIVPRYSFWMASWAFGDSIITTSTRPAHCPTFAPPSTRFPFWD
jgi:hypothetical protein